MNEARKTAHAPPPATAVDFRQAWAIVRATLMMRIRVGGGARLSRSGKSPGLFLLCVVYAAMGAFVGTLAFLPVDPFTYGTIVFGMTLTLGGSVVIAESSQVLFNTAEADILGHRPIHPRTLLLAKSISLFLLSAIVSGALNLGPAIMGMWIGHPSWAFPLTHALTTALAALFCSGAVVFVYALVTRWVGRERFDGFLVWVQVGVSIVIVAGFQVVPRMVDRIQGFRIPSESPWLAALPPAWFGAVEALASGAAPTPLLAAMAALAVLASAGLAWGAIGKLSDDYARMLASLGETPAPAVPVAGASVREDRPMPAWLKSWMPDPIERGAFRLASAYLSRDRDVRMRLYPSLGTIAVFAILPLIDPAMGRRTGPILVLAFIGMLAASTMSTLRMSSHHAASDIFRYAPLPGTAAVFHGVRKAVMLKFVLPVFLGVLPILWFSIRQRESLLVIVPVLLAIPTLSLFGGMAGDYLPLSAPLVVGRQGLTNISAMIVGALTAGVISGLGMLALHFHWFWPMVVIEIVLLAGLHALLLKGIRARPLAPLT